MTVRDDPPEPAPDDWDAADSAPLEVPYTALSREALQGIVESVVLREGTDYGDRERTLAQKTDELLERLRRREARIVFDPRTRSVDIVAAATRAPSAPRRSDS